MNGGKEGGRQIRVWEALSPSVIRTLSRSEIQRPVQRRRDVCNKLANRAGSSQGGRRGPAAREEGRKVSAQLQALGGLPGRRSRSCWGSLPSHGAAASLAGDTCPGKLKCTWRTWPFRKFIHSPLVPRPTCHNSVNCLIFVILQNMVIKHVISERGFSRQGPT